MSSVEEFRTEEQKARFLPPVRAVDVCGAASLPATGAHGEAYGLDDRQRLFLFSRADTLYAGSDEIRRTIVAERVLGLPKEVRA